MFAEAGQVGKPAYIFEANDREFGSMRRRWQFVICLLFLSVTASIAQAQWILAFEDKTRRDLNGIFFLDQNFGWIIGDGGIIHATQTNGQGWVVQYPRVKAN